MRDTARAHSQRGSSPLTRGKRIAKIAERRLCRLIPAHAGKTTLTISHSVLRTAHPRSRGENQDDSAPVDNVPGSSPLTRGKLGRRRRSSAAAGLIPAHAGKTLGPSSPPRLRRAHPRSRGENKLVPDFLLQYQGSSPLTRGKPSERGCVSCLTGLIPAHAGKTEGMVRLGHYAEAHPRSRGEN